MKKLLLTVICLTNMLAIAYPQAKKQATATKNVDITQTLKNKTTKWFKDYYVQLNFKDPYSYKLMKCIVSPVTNKEYLEDSKREITLYSLPDIDTTSNWNKYGDAKKEAEKAEYDYKRSLKNNASDTSFYRKNLFYKTKFKERIKDEFETKVNLVASIDSLLVNSENSFLSSVKQFKVYIDAYGRNSFGNLVLEKYYYTIDEKAVIQGEVKKFD